MKLHFSAEHGLLLDWEPGNGLPPQTIGLRVEIRGSNVFYVWGSLGVDSGETAPVWAEPDLNLTYFGGDAESHGLTCRVETIARGDVAAGYRVVGEGPRAVVMLDLRDDGPEGVSARLDIHNPAGPGGRALPVCLAALRCEALTAGADATYASAHPYGGGTHPCGPISDLPGTDGVEFIHGCIGLALPLVYLHSPAARGGIEFEFMLDDRPVAWLRPGARPDQVDWRLEWTLDRRLAPGQVHAFGGRLRVRGYAGEPVEQMRAWRDRAEARYGLRSPEKPEWVRRAVLFGIVLTTENPHFSRLDAPEVRQKLRRWKSEGVNTLFVISCNPSGLNALSPIDYSAPEPLGGAAAERYFLDCVHEEGMHAGLWFTTVGIDRNTPDVAAHADWWTHRVDQSLFYAWDSTPQSQYVGYAPDADPLSSGWRGWLLGQAKSLIERGYDGVFLDGCIPRASNHARWDWPGAGRNGIPDQVLELASAIHGWRGDASMWIEDGALYAQTAYGVVHSRYWPTSPNLKKPARFDPGMLGGPKSEQSATEPIPPEMAREYQAIRLASMLPGVAATEGIANYVVDSCGPWQATAAMTGSVLVWDRLDDPGEWTANPSLPPPSEREKSREHRLRANADLQALVKLVSEEPVLMREAPVSLDGVRVEGDAAVLGVLRPLADSPGQMAASPKGAGLQSADSPSGASGRCLLAVIQYADRPAQVSLRLADPVDVPAVQRAQAGHPETARWAVREILRSMADEEAAPAGFISGDEAYVVPIGPYGYRVFELTSLP